MSDNDARSCILREATRLFAEQGYASASVREIVEAAGVTKPTLYYHFGSKEGLFTALVDHHVDAWLERVDAIARGQGDFAEASVTHRLRAYVEETFRTFLDDPQVLRFLAQAFHQAGQGAPEVDSMRFHATECRLLTELLAEGVARGELRDHPPMDGALMLMGAVRVRLGAALEGGPTLPEDAADRLFDLFLHGVSP